MNTDASILVYKFSPERTGFNMDAEYTQTAINCPCIITLLYINLRQLMLHQINLCPKFKKNMKKYKNKKQLANLKL